MGRTKRERAKRQPNSSLPSPSIHHKLYKFLSLRNWNNTNQLTVSSFPLTGRGLYSKRDLIEHDLIIELPYQRMISYPTLANDDEFRSIFSMHELEKAKSLVSFQALLALYCHHQKLKGESSEWFAYIQTLPETFTNPYFCKKSELYFLPELVLEKIVDQNNSIKSNFQSLISLVRQDVRDNYNLDTFKWAFFVCNSRSVYINEKWLEPLVDRHDFKELLNDSPNMALAPLLDLLNHSNEVSTRSQLSHSQGFVVQQVDKIISGEVHLSYQLYTSKAIKKFDQIFINYGTFNNTKLLLEYGFVVPDNPMDFLEISLEDINNYVKSHPMLRTLLIPKHKYKFIRDHDLDQQMFIDANDGLSHNFQVVLSILLLPQNIYNLTQVAFGDELNFEDVKLQAIEILREKKLSFTGLSNELERHQDLSASGEVCLKYFEESMKLVDKVLNIVDKPWRKWGNKFFVRCSPSSSTSEKMIF